MIEAKGGGTGSSSKCCEPLTTLTGGPESEALCRYSAVSMTRTLGSGAKKRAANVIPRETGAKAVTRTNAKAKLMWPRPPSTRVWHDTWSLK